MPNLKISELPSGNPAVSTDEIPIARSGANYRITLGSMGSVMTNLAAWQSVQTANFTATAGKGYPVNTTSGQITVTLPLIPSVGDVVAFTDYAGTFGTNRLNIDPNGNNINGSSSVYIATTNRTGLQLAYVDATQGWVCYGDTSGGVVTETFVIQGLVVAGGASGGAGIPSGGGGGAGGFRTYLSTYPLSPSPGTVETGTVTVGAGGAGVAPPSGGNQGNPSVLNTITSAGGGYGGFRQGNPGGSGGGSGTGTNPAVPGGSGNIPATSPAQGFPGGLGGTGFGASGGGAGGAGSNGGYPPSAGGNSGLNNLLGRYTSSTSNAITAIPGTGAAVSYTFTIETGQTIAAGEWLRANYDSSNWIEGTVTSYNSGTGSLVVAAYRTTGSGTYTSWVFQRTYAGGGSAASNGSQNTPTTAFYGSGSRGQIFSSSSAANAGIVLISVPNTASVTFSGGVTSTMTTVGTKKVYTVTATSTTSETYTVTVP